MNAKPMSAEEWMDADAMRQAMDGKWPLNVMDAYAAYRVREALEEVEVKINETFEKLVLVSPDMKRMNPLLALIILQIRALKEEKLK